MQNWVIHILSQVNYLFVPRRQVLLRMLVIFLDQPDQQAQLDLDQQVTQDPLVPRVPTVQRVQQDLGQRGILATLVVPDILVILDILE